MSTADGPVLGPTARTRLQRLPQRGHFDFETIAAVLDAALLVHVGFVVEGQPYVIPTLHGRLGRTLYIHGSAASRMLRTLREGPPLCVTASVVDGLVLARSAFHHSANYRSVVVLGRARLVDDDGERLAALRAISEQVLAGRWDEVREPNERELKATLVLALPLEEGSAKIRSGPPSDDEEDYARDCWAGVLPLKLVPGEPQPDGRLRPGTPLSPAVARRLAAAAARLG